MMKQKKPKIKKLENMADWHALNFGDAVHISGLPMVYKDDCDKGKEFVRPSNINSGRIPARIIREEDITFDEGILHPREYFVRDYIRGEDGFDRAYEALRKGGLI